MAAAENEGHLGHIRNHGDAVGMGQQRIGKPHIRHGLDFLQDFGRRQQLAFFARASSRDVGDTGQSDQWPRETRRELNLLRLPLMASS